MISALAVIGGINLITKINEGHVRLDKPVEKVSIIMPAYNEESTIGMALDSLSKQLIMQEYPDYFETIIALDARTDDKTYDIVKNYDVDLLVVDEPGILSARSIAIDKSKGQIIVSTNADTYYKPEWLGNVVYHFNDINNVAVTTPRLFDGQPIVNFFMRAWTPIDRKMYGSNSAFRKDAYYMTGGFDLSINQFDGRELQMEEEVKFRDRLQEVGNIVFEFTPVYTSFRRQLCFIGKQNAFCDEIKTKSRFGVKI